MLNEASSKRRPCETQMTLTVEDLASETDKRWSDRRNPNRLVESFHKVPHKSLLLQLDFYGIKGKIKRRIEDFLSNRTQQVVAEGEHSYTGSVTSDVAPRLRPRTIPLLDLYQRPR